MPELNNALDNHLESPVEGQAEEVTQESMREELGNLGFEEEVNPEVNPEGNTEEPTIVDKVVVGEKEYRSVDEMQADLENFLQNEKKYEELRKKLSQRDELAERAKQYDQFFQQNKEVLDFVDKFTSDENLKTLVTAYERDLINKDQLEQARRYLSQQQMQQPQQMQQQVPPQLMNEINQLKQSQQQLVMNEAYNTVSEDYKALENEYSDLIEKEGVSIEQLTQIAGEHAFFKQGKLAPKLPDLKQAFNYYVASNPNAFKTLQQVMSNNQSQKAKELNNAQVEKNTIRQPQGQGKGDSIVDDILHFSRSRGGGVL